jgi:SAM-dependent methyltransferase
VGAVDLTAKFDVPAELVAATDKAVIRKLSVGAGAKDKEEGFVTIDIAGEPDVRHDITVTPWPFEDDYFRGVKAHHILEHLPSHTLHIDWDARKHWYTNSTIDVMNEMWRILEPEGRCWIELPVYPTEDSVSDPQHVKLFTSKTFDYFVKDGEYEEQRQLYGIKPWALQRREKLNYGRILYVLLRKVSDD